MFLSQRDMVCGSYLLERSSSSIDDDEIIIVLSLLAEDAIYRIFNTIGASLSILYKVKEQNIDLRKSLSKLAAYDRSSFWSLADGFIVDCQDDGSYFSLVADNIEKIWHKISPIDARRSRSGRWSYFPSTSIKNLHGDSINTDQM